MTPKRRQRLYTVLTILVTVGAATTLGAIAFRENAALFKNPSDLIDGNLGESRLLRVGGMVAKGSVSRASDSLKVSFDLTDYKHHVTVEYEGILPDLFREGQGIVVQGTYQGDGKFHASEVLAKHDENYMPTETRDALRASGFDAEGNPVGDAR